MIYYTSEGKPYIKYTSDNIEEILKALGTAQLTFKELKQSGRNTFFKGQDNKGSQYSTLKDIFNACGGSLKDNGISIISTMARINTKNMFIQTLVHSKSGQFISSSADMGEYDNIHTVGSKITYFRRYLLQPMLNLEGDYATDDDGNTGQTLDKPKKEIDYDYVDGEFRKLTAKGDIVETFDDFESYTKSLAIGIVKHKNITVLKSNEKEMRRVAKYLESLTDNNTLAKQNALHTLKEGLAIIESNNAQN